MALAEEQELEVLNVSGDIFIDPSKDKDLIEVNDVIEIFKDPLFKTDSEGSATVDKVLMSDGQQDLAMVTLDANGVQVQRWIKKTYVNGKFPYTLPITLR